MDPIWKRTQALAMVGLVPHTPAADVAVGTCTGAPTMLPGGEPVARPPGQLVTVAAFPDAASDSLLVACVLSSRMYQACGNTVAAGVHSAVALPSRIGKSDAIPDRLVPPRPPL